jgi:hypothetical protein
MRDPATGEIRQATASGWKVVAPPKGQPMPPINPLALDDDEFDLEGEEE